MLNHTWHVSVVSLDQRNMHLTKKQIGATERIKRANIINSVTGIKPANLIGTKSNDGFPNVGIISSVVHLGSDPALIGFILRPQHEKPRDTYLNIKENGYYTINHVSSDFVEKAHWTSPKFTKVQSEFEMVHLSEVYLDGFHAPYVGESQIKVGLKLVDEMPIKYNMTILIIGEVEHIYLPDHIMDEEGHLQLESAQSAGISGLNSYYSLKKEAQFPYARVKDLPQL